jgi:hypothetical protein
MTRKGTKTRHRIKVDRHEKRAAETITGSVPYGSQTMVCTTQFEHLDGTGSTVGHSLQGSFSISPGQLTEYVNRNVYRVEFDAYPSSWPSPQGDLAYATLRYEQGRRDIV